MNTQLQLGHSASFLARIGSFLAHPIPQVRAKRQPLLEDISYRLMVRAMSLPANATAMAFQTILERASKVRSSEWAFLAEAPEGKKVLVDNEFLKVVLIRWEPGVTCARHGHPNGGGMVKVLEGAIRESRFLNATITAPYETNVFRQHSASYIDDRLGLHTVGNPFELPAVTMHAYLKYRK